VAVDRRDGLLAAAPPPKRAKKASGGGSPVGVLGSNESRRVQPSTEVACRVRDLSYPGGWTWILGTVVSYAPDVKKYYVADAAGDGDGDADTGTEEGKLEDAHLSARRRMSGMYVCWTASRWRARRWFLHSWGSLWGRGLVLVHAAELCNW